MSNQRLFFLEKNGKEFRMKYLRRLLLVLLALLFMVSACFVGRYIWQSFQTQRDFQQLQEEKSKNRDLKALWNRNPDLIGWISIAGTEIDYPVMQTKEEPEFYLRRNFKKEYSLAGTPFLDAASDVALPTSNWLLYGHNMQDGTMNPFIGSTQRFPLRRSAMEQEPMKSLRPFTQKWIRKDFDITTMRN